MFLLVLPFTVYDVQSRTMHASPLRLWYWRNGTINDRIFTVGVQNDIDYLDLVPGKFTSFVYESFGF